MSDIRTELFWLKMRRTKNEIRVKRPEDLRQGSPFSNRAIRYFPATGTLEQAHHWSIATGNPVECRREADAKVPDYTMLPDGRGKRGFQ